MTPLGRLRLASVAGAMLLPAWILRAVLLSGVEGGNAVPLDDAAGFLADAGLAAMATSAVLASLRRSRAAAFGLVLSWTLLQLVTFESVRALDALPSFADAGYLADPTFVLGSGLGILTSPWPVAVTLLAIALLWLGRLADASARHLAAGFVTGALLIGLQISIGWSPGVADWRQTHALLHALSGLAGPSAPLPTRATVDVGAIASELAVDLSGEPEVETPPGSPNVLLILVESISGAYVPSLAAAHGREAEPSMTELDEFARTHRSFSTFVTHQVNTNRGLYAALCGDLPKLVPGTPKMSVHAATGLSTCLPALLKNAGYRTAYLQAAPLAFMLKDQFLPRIGFDEVVGDGSFGQAAARSEWGVDDGTLFAEGLALVGRLRTGDAPWFATLLTVGTHHPYLVPDEFEPEMDDDFARAIAYADRKLGGFLRALEAMGVFEDTLVLVTSDESRGRRGDGDAVSQLLSHAWGILVAAGPGIARAQVDVSFGLSDLPASVLDYLGRGEQAYRAQLLGRSVFRRYARPRHVFFANSRRGAAGAIDPEGRVLLCRRRFQHCEAFEAPDGVFGALRRPTQWDAPGGGVLASVARFSVTSGGSAEGGAAREPDTIELMESRRVELPDASPRLIHGGQNVELREGEWIEVELDATATGQVGIELHHTLKDAREVRLDAIRPLAPGSRLHLAYTFVPDAGFRRTQCLSVVKTLGDGPGSLEFAVARLHVRRGGGPPPRGVTIVTDELEPLRARRRRPAPTSP